MVWFTTDFCPLCTPCLCGNGSYFPRGAACKEPASVMDRIAAIAAMVVFVFMG